jgi:hypothetical protein
LHFLPTPVAKDNRIVVHALHLTRTNSETIRSGHLNKVIKILQIGNQVGRVHLKDEAAARAVIINAG